MPQTAEAVRLVRPADSRDRAAGPHEDRSAPRLRRAGDGPAARPAAMAGGRAGGGRPGDVGGAPGVRSPGRCGSGRRGRASHAGAPAAGERA